jgi:hypothetical protein
MTRDAERRFPVRIRIGVPPSGLGQRHTQITAWLDENCGANGWAMTPSGTRGVVNDALSIYFADATLANAFVARRCVGAKADTIGDVFQVREDEPARLGAALHRTHERRSWHRLIDGGDDLGCYALDAPILTPGNRCKYHRGEKPRADLRWYAEQDCGDQQRGAAEIKECRTCFHPVNW